jgi:hypothetical protein
MASKTATHFEHIDSMSADFNALFMGPGQMTPEVAAYWQLRILLSIAQQLSVISQSLKEREE